MESGQGQQACTISASCKNKYMQLFSQTNIHENEITNNLNQCMGNVIYWLCLKFYTIQTLGRFIVQTYILQEIYDVNNQWISQIGTQLLILWTSTMYNRLRFDVHWKYIWLPWLLYMAIQNFSVKQFIVHKNIFLIFLCLATWFKWKNL